MSEPGKTDWAELYQAATEFRQAAPWTWMRNEDLFAVENPADGQAGYCSILGMGKEEYGLGMFLGEDGLRSYLNLVSGEESPEWEDQAMIPKLTMLLADRADLQKKDIDVIRSLGLRFRGRNAWLLFRSQKPGYAPWFLDKEEAVFLTAAIQQALVVAGQVRDRRVDLSQKEAEGEVLTCCYRHGHWLQEWRRRPGESHGSAASLETADVVNEARLRLLRGAKKQTSQSWEFDIFLMPLHITPPSSTPYYPLCFLLMDKRSGFIIGTETTDPWLSTSEKQEKVIESLEKAKLLPRSIWVKSDRIAGIVKPVAKSLGIDVRVGSLPMLEEAKVSLCQHLLG
ncbi:MAG: hypothetical protein NTU41_05510 [Chloroflexi bacterium]|nr:hypothetical protein [Chloroflexota bacterium]